MIKKYEQLKKYYLWSILVNFIPVIVTYIILHDCSGDGCMGKFLIWLTIPIWMTIYLMYFLLNKNDNSRFIEKLIIYSPSLFASFTGIFITIINDREMMVFFHSFLILILPSFLYNIFVEYRINQSTEKTNEGSCRVIAHPITFIVGIIVFVFFIYKPSYYEEDIFTFGRIEVEPSTRQIQMYLSDSANNEYLLPDSIIVLPYPDYHDDWIGEDDYFLYFKESPTEVIHIKVVDCIPKPYIKIKGTKTLKEKYKWQWKVKVKKNDIEAKRVLNRIDRTIKEIDSGIVTEVKIHTP